MFQAEVLTGNPTRKPRTPGGLYTWKLKTPMSKVESHLRQNHGGNFNDVKCILELAICWDWSGWTGTIGRVTWVISEGVFVHVHGLFSGPPHGLGGARWSPTEVWPPFLMTFEMGGEGYKPLLLWSDGPYLQLVRGPLCSSEMMGFDTLKGHRSHCCFLKLIQLVGN